MTAAGKELSVYTNAAAVWANEAQEHAHGGALAGAILAQKPIYLASAYGKGEVLHGLHMPERLGQVLGFYYMGQAFGNNDLQVNTAAPGLLITENAKYYL